MNKSICNGCIWHVRVNTQTPTFAADKCIHNGSSRVIRNVTDTPDWCPLKDKKMETKKKFKDLPYWERSKAWESIPPRVKWEDIEANKIYHVPPYMNEKREDIKVIGKTSNSITYVKVTKTPNHIVYTLYPGSIMAKFLVPNMLQNIEFEIK